MFPRRGGVGWGGTCMLAHLQLKMDSERLSLLKSTSELRDFPNPF